MGTAESSARARNMLQRAIDGDVEIKPGEVAEEVELGNATAAVIGRGGSNVADLENRHGVKVNVRSELQKARVVGKAQSTSTAPKQQQEEEEAKGCRFKPFHEERWDQKLLELRVFRKRHGHCLVPHTYPPNPQLARWVKRQRRQFKLMQDGRPSTMTPDRVEILEQDGFVWDSHEAAWREKIEDLRKYRAKHGHCLVPSNYKENPQLATWVKCQRRQYKLYWESKPSAMNPTRIAELESEGFRWELRNNVPNNVAKSASSDHQSPTKQVESAASNDQIPTKQQVENMNQNELKVLHDIISML